MTPSRVPLTRAFLLVLLAACSTHAASISSGWYYGVVTSGGGSPQIIVNNGPTNVTIQNLNQPGPRICPGCPTIPGYFYDQTSDALLFGSATADSMHGFVQATDTVTLGPNAPPGGGVGPSSFANFGFNTSDIVHFTSGILPAGTPVSFQLSETLHSLIGATTAGTCNLPVGLGYSPTGSATLQMLALNSGDGLLGQLQHDSCGAGSDLITLSGTFQSTIGGTFGFRSQFALSASAAESFAQTGAARTTVDASNTGSITIQVLTPNAGFTSDSGAAYTGVPEPSTGVLFLGAGSTLVAWRGGLAWWLGVLAWRCW